MGHVRRYFTASYLDDWEDARYVLLSKIGLLVTNLTVSTVTSYYLTLDAANKVK